MLYIIRYISICGGKTAKLYYHNVQGNVGLTRAYTCVYKLAPSRGLRANASDLYWARFTHHIYTQHTTQNWSMLGRNGVCAVHHFLTLSFLSYI